MIKSQNPLQSKTEQVRSLLLSGDTKEALKLSKDFRLGLTPAQSKAIKMGYECMVHPAFYLQLKVDIQATVDAGVKALTELVSKKEAA